MNKVLGMGNALVDIMTKLEDDSFLTKHDLPKGSMQLVSPEKTNEVQNASSSFDQKLTSGGSASNTIHGIARLGLATGFVGCVGDDKIGNFFKKDMEEASITPHLFKGENASGTAIALVSPDSERTFAVSLGAAIELTANHIDINIFKGYDIFHIEGYLVQNHELIEKAVVTAKQAGLKVSLDLASFNVVEDNLEFLQRIVRDYVDIVFANEEESKAFTTKEPREALDIIAEMCEIAVVKIGKDGSYIKRNNEVTKCGVIDVTPIDTTGAGDLYASGLLYGLIKNLPMNKCGEIGALLSGMVIELIGAKLDNERWLKALKQIDEIENRQATIIN